MFFLKKIAYNKVTEKKTALSVFSGVGLKYSQQRARADGGEFCTFRAGQVANPQALTDVGEGMKGVEHLPFPAQRLSLS